MRRLPVFILALPFALAACGEDGMFKQWIDPDKSFSKLPQPDVSGVQATMEKQAADAVAAGDNMRAGQFYAQLLEVKTASEADKARYRMAIADTLRRLGENDKALEAYKEILKTAPADLDAREGKALVLMAQNKFADAGRDFSEVMKINPNRWRTLNALGILFVTKNMIPEALQYYTEALRHSPDNPAVLNNVGLSRAVDKDYPRAIEALEQAARVVTVESRRRQVELNLAMVQGIAGDNDKAREIASKHLEGAALDNNLGFYAHLAKDDALAKTYLNMALSNSATFYQRAWNNLDIISGGQGAGDSSR